MNIFEFIAHYNIKQLRRRKFMATLQRVALIITIIGALNWGLVGLFEFDLVAALFNGAESVISRTVYTIIGIASLINIGLLFEDLD
jgi:uncharacterized membrane protein YuzA (DUF378 family)